MDNKILQPFINNNKEKYAREDIELFVRDVCNRVGLTTLSKILEDQKFSQMFFLIIVAI